MKLTLKIERDEYPSAPNEYDDCVFLVANHRQCFIPPSEKERRFDVQDVIDRHAKAHHVFILEAYIHSGVVLALQGEGNFPDRQWDVSTLGAVFVPKSEQRLRKSARKIALGKVEEWNQYLSGDVWGYAIEDEDGNQVDSCCGFYGHDYAKQEGESALAHAQKSQDEADAKEQVEREDAACRDLVTA